MLSFVPISLIGSTRLNASSETHIFVSRSGPNPINRSTNRFSAATYRHSDRTDRLMRSCSVARENHGIVETIWRAKKKKKRNE